MGWDYLLNGSKGKPWSARSASERYEGKAERAARMRQVMADKRAQAVAAADALARRVAADLAAKRRSEAGADKVTEGKRGPRKGAAVHVSTGKALLNKFGAAGRPPASEIGPRLAGSGVVAPAPIGYSQMRAKQQAAASAAARARKPAGKGGK